MPTLSDPSLGRTQLRSEVASHLRTAIFSGQFKPGEFLRLSPIAHQLGVSITPVREAMLTLASEGYVVQEPRRGFAVANLTRGDLNDQFYVQGMIGGELCSRASANLTDETIEALSQNIEETKNVIHQKHSVQLKLLINEFHRIINLSANSPRLTKILGGIASQNPTEFLAQIEGQADASYREHIEIYDALVEGNTEKSRDLMFDHISHIGGFVIDALSQKGFWRHID
ncbi:DNA-binding transcriptional regulator, GntR family [Brevibacterium sandarakinum]|uniref:DNA-binding transcriptional regulator, GntR family n=1 Tax=Brevibacterium sandarakinum TaxID=629680 RepID=A0A1H1SCW9_BRESA|nr:GntR family transcriptional regulator [Brevibacterium sandarakinum]SDS45586.1 DNA-binding transcriptional regulator, GntR family [Brevibacterium sandarakinum]